MPPAVAAAAGNLIARWSSSDRQKAEGVHMPFVSNETLPLTVHNTGFLLDRLGADCHPLQFLRELTQNSIEAVLRTPEKTGHIVWDVDWTPFDVGEQGPYKLCVTDNGCGMTGEEMVQYINQLSSSAGVQSVDGNYGVGAKIAAATRNHAGLIYLSWKNGHGSMIHLWRNPTTGQYGLRQVRRDDGTFGHFSTVDDAVKPDLIGDHGTRIVLFGMRDDADTMKPPSDTPSPSTWIAKYLNARYFRFPDGITVRARQGWEQPRSNKDVNLLRSLNGQKAYLDSHRVCSGEVVLTDAIARWWILKDEPALGSNSGYIESSGHVAALFRDELYELSTARSGHARLQQFGVIFGQRQVVIYVEPTTSEKRRVTTNTARTQLLINGEPMPWTDWAAEFRTRIPDEIRALMDDIASRSAGSDHGKSIRERLKSLMDLYKVSRYKPSANGVLRIDDPQPQTGGEAAIRPRVPGPPSPTPPSPPKPGPVGGVYSAFLKSDGIPGAQVKPELFPQVKWVSTAEGTREPGDIEDKAARFLGDQHLLLINADFRVFADMIEHWQQRYEKEHGPSGGLRDVITDSVRDWYEQALVETVIGVQALKGSREWSIKQIADALSEEALTSVVMQRYHPYNSVKRELGTKIAPLKK
jgi:hypothetical protein